MAARARAVAESQRAGRGGRIVIAVIGSDRPGIMAGITAILAGRGANILDVSQTIMSDLFTMIMLVDIKGAAVSFRALKAELETHGARQGLSVIVQHEDIFRAMHRV
jgi:ACT domain-containing protein